jgi:HD-GYP domain-containing protein (c-di-GMP phosphodiesterase class II)
VRDKVPNKPEKFLQTLQQILDVSTEFSQAKDVDLLLDKILNRATKLANADGGSIFIIEKETLRLHHSQDTLSAEPSSPKKPFLYPTASAPVLHDSIPAYIVKTKEIVNIPDLSRPSQNLPYTIDLSHVEGASYQCRSLLAFPLNNSNGDVIGVIQLVNSRDDEGNITALSEDDTPLIQLFANSAGNAIERTQVARERILGIIQILAALRDPEETVAHVKRIGAYAAEIYESWAQKKGHSQKAITAHKDTLRISAMLHDLGKLAIPNIIRKKPDRLSQEEYAMMKQHTVKGAQLLLEYAHSEIEQVAAQIALTHHERWDGKGYPGHIDPLTGEVIPGYEDQQGNPRGKQGEEIPVLGRVVCVADVYDSLSNHRIFRAAWKEEDILEKLKRGSGTHFDPEMIEAFFASLDTIHAIAERFPA